MENRRNFLKKTLKSFVGLGLLFSPFVNGVQLVYGKAKKIILPKGTDRKTLIDKNPRSLDTRNLEITPLKDFETMGVTDYDVNFDDWRLKVSGRIEAPIKLAYSQILALPPIERDVLLICPGFFANHGKWKGFSIGKLLKKAKVAKGVTHVSFSGPAGKYEESFPIEDIYSNKVFLAYGVNGEILPEKHGFPLRVVAESYYGSDWVKFVSHVNVGEA